MRSIFIGLLGVFSITFGDWMQEQIAHDLAPFAKIDLSFDALTKAIERPGPIDMHAEVAHIAIEKGRARVKAFLTTGDWVAGFRLKRMVLEINKWQKSAHTRPSRLLPDSEFLLSLSDGLDADKRLPYINTEKFPVPVFTFSKRKSSSRLVLFPNNYALTTCKKIRRDVAKGIKAFPWEKKQESLFWQGTCSDGAYTKDKWSENPRAALVLLSRQEPGLVDARFTGFFEMDRGVVFNEILGKTGPLIKAVSPKEMLHHKYLIDLDGVSCHWQDTFIALLADSVLVKQESPFIQWFSKRLKPEVHYIPVKRDLSDLKQRLEWAKTHDKEALQIAKNGQALAAELFNQSCTFEYIGKLLRAYNECFQKERGEK